MMIIRLNKWKKSGLGKKSGAGTAWKKSGAGAAKNKPSKDGPDIKIDWLIDWMVIDWMEFYFDLV